MVTLEQQLDFGGQSQFLLFINFRLESFTPPFPLLFSSKLVSTNPQLHVTPFFCTLTPNSDQDSRSFMTLILCRASLFLVFRQVKTARKRVSKTIKVVSSQIPPTFWCRNQDLGAYYQPASSVVEVHLNVFEATPSVVEVHFSVFESIILQSSYLQTQLRVNISIYYGRSQSNYQVATWFSWCSHPPYQQTQENLE